MKKEYFTIPNLMGYFRILMIPVFLILYHNAKTNQDYLIALLVLAVSMFTDLLDGKIARKFHMVTDFGKILDPIADKLTHGAMAIALAFHHPFMIYFLILFVIKEGYMGIMGYYLVKKEQKVTGALWYGKVCTCVMDAGIFVLLLFPHMSVAIADSIIIFVMIIMFATLVKYITWHVSLIRNLRAEGK